MTPTAPMLSDLSAYVISGRVVQEAEPGAHESDARTPADGVQDGVDAERIGFRRVFLSERWNLKEAAVILSAIVPTVIAERWFDPGVEPPEEELGIGPANMLAGAPEGKPSVGPT